MLLLGIKVVLRLHKVHILMILVVYVLYLPQLLLPVLAADFFISYTVELVELLLGWY